MTQAGVPFDKTVVANLETGRRRFVTVSELLALAYVLDVAPVHLLVPIDDDATAYQAVPGAVAVPPEVARSWVRGFDVIGDMDIRRFASEVPPHEYGPDAQGRLTFPQQILQLDKLAEERGLRLVVRTDGKGGAFMQMEPTDDNDAGR